jgi:hypothetical protein
MAPKMSRRQRDHIIAKNKFRDMVALAKERNPKLFGEHPDKWDPQQAYIQGYLDACDVAEKIAQKAHKLVNRTHASTQEGHLRLQDAMDTMERLMKEVDKRAPVAELRDMVEGSDITKSEEAK